MANPAFSDMMDDLFADALFGSDTIVVALPGVSSATITTAHVTRRPSTDNAGEGSRGLPVQSELTVRVLSGDLSASYTGHAEATWTTGSCTVEGVAYGIDEALIRHGLVKLTLGGELLQERTRSGLRR